MAVTEDEDGSSAFLDPHPTLLHKGGFFGVSHREGLYFLGSGLEYERTPAPAAYPGPQSCPLCKSLAHMGSKAFLTCQMLTS